MNRISPQELMQQACWTAHTYAAEAAVNLCRVLDIDRGAPGWRKQIEPFAAVLAAMVAASAADFDTGMKHIEHAERMEAEPPFDFGEEVSSEDAAAYDTAHGRRWRKSSS